MTGGLQPMADNGGKRQGRRNVALALALAGVALAVYVIFFVASVSQ